MAEMGLYYPNVGIQSDRDPGHYKILRINPENAMWDLDIDELKKVKIDCENANERNIDNILLSNEHIYSYLCSPHGVRFFDEVKKYFPDAELKLIIYLRRHDDYIKSSYNQLFKGCASNFRMFHLKYSNREIKYSSYIKSAVGHCKNLTSVLALCHQHCSSENIIYRFYRQKQNNVIDDFLDIFYLSATGMKINHTRDNVALPSSLLPILSSMVDLRLGYETTQQLSVKIFESFGEKQIKLMDDSDTTAIEESIEQIDSFCPGYKDLFANHPLDLSWPEMDLPAKEHLTYRLLFSLYAQNMELVKRLDALYAKKAENSIKLKIRRALKQPLIYILRRFPERWQSFLRRTWTRLVR
ncbi:MAG: hypothetical protein LBG69_05020 [Zoogloeaceae bacterium]|nr:hypothetical protein [Zoogloeaceae bacterium]